MKYYITIERSLSRGYEIEANSEEEMQRKAEELLASLMEIPSEMEDGGESWDYAVSGEDGQDVIT